MIRWVLLLAVACGNEPRHADATIAKPLDAQVYEDAKQYNDAKIYEDAKVYRDAAIDAL